MAHNLLDNKFYSHRQPAWHGLGHVLEHPLTADEAFKLVGPYRVVAEPLFCKDGISANSQALRREDGEVFNVVGPEYVAVEPQQLCEVWDQATGAKLETLGVLGKGERMFMTTKLPSIGIRGDEVEQYLLLHGVFDGKRANEIIHTGVRVVCQNTLIAAGAMATSTLRVIHDQGCKERLWTWLHDAWEQAEAKVGLLKEAYEMLAAHPVTTEERVRVLETAYPMPKQPRNDAPADVMRERARQVDHRREVVSAKRTAAAELFAGKGQGMDLPAAKGTGWGLYNAVVELEDFSNRTKTDTTMGSALFGNRAETKGRAFEETLAISRN